MLSDEVAISDLGRIVTGKTPSTKNPTFFDGDYQFVTPSDLDWKTYYCQSTERTVTEDARKAHSNQFIPSDAIMVTCIGNTIGKCGISSGDCLTNQQINSIIPATGINSRFIYYLMIQNSELIRGFGLGGGSATPILNKTTFSKIRLRVPSKSHWAHIAAILSAYDDLIENNRRRIQLLEQSAQLLYKEWFTYLRFPGHEHVTITDGVPEGWERASVSSFCTVGRGGSPRPIKDYLGGTVPWFKIGDATASKSPFVFSTNEQIIEDGIKKSVFLPPQELILSNSATCGIPYFTGISGCIHDGWLYFKKLQRISKWFLYCGLFAKQNEILMGIGEGTTQKNLNTDYIGKQAFLLPKEDALLRIFDNIVAPIFDQIFSLSQQNLQLVQARDLLLPRLMNGEISV